MEYEINRISHIAFIHNGINKAAYRVSEQSRPRRDEGEECEAYFQHTRRSDEPSSNAGMRSYGALYICIFSSLSITAFQRTITYKDDFVPWQGRILSKNHPLRPGSTTTHEYLKLAPQDGPYRKDAIRHLEGYTHIVKIFS